ncbi:hypothetical protein J2X76_001399 [Neorhizobium sp. 2083]|nr:hypothetical protein [Neorhizobium sp. 2083]
MSVNPEQMAALASENYDAVTGECRPPFWMYGLNDRF